MLAFLRVLVAGAAVALAWVGYQKAVDVMDGHEAEVAEQAERISGLEGDLASSRDQLQRTRSELTTARADIVDLRQDVAERDATIAEQEDTISEQALALRHLKIDRRLARLEVLDQGDDGAGGVQTRVRFIETGADGEALGEPVEAVLPGRMVYIESLVMKFDDSYVEQGDVWRGASVCLFRRMFSEGQKPSEGTILDPEGMQPLAYGDDEPQSPLAPVWRRFWDYANDPAAAASLGVRAVHGEAPFIELREGASYEVELRASGGLSLTRQGR